MRGGGRRGGQEAVGHRQQRVRCGVGKEQEMEGCLTPLSLSPLWQ